MATDTVQATVDNAMGGTNATQEAASTPFPSFTTVNATAPDATTPEEIPNLKMSLADAVHLALRHNRNVKSAYLNRVIEKYNLDVAEDQFWPNIDLVLKTERTLTRSKTTEDEDDTGTSSSKSGTDSATTTLTEQVPTGGNFSFSWANSGSDNYATTNHDDSRTRSGQNTWTVNVTQPLLKGAGWDVNMTALRQARNAEKTNILGLKSQLITTVSSTITAYRSYLQAWRQIEISKSSLERAKQLYEVNKTLIEAGRMAAMDIIQTEADMANREVAYQDALNSLDSARLRLLQVLDIDKRTQIHPTESILIKNIEPDYAYCLDIAFKNKPDWLSALINIQDTRMNLRVAENNRLWDLSLGGSYTYSDTQTKDNPDTKQGSASGSLTLSVPVYGDMTRRQQYLAAKNSLRRAEISLEELKDNTEIELKDAVRNVRSQLKQTRLATRARELSEQKLNVEREKLHLGLTSNFQIVSYQNDLVNAQESEISAQISYLNALTTLDQLLGTTLDTWNIEFRDERPEVEREILDD